MEISKHKVAGIHYTLRDNEGTVLDSSEGRDPLYYIQGVGNLIPGMEEGLEGKAKGDKLKIKVSPERGYGVVDPARVQQVPVNAFAGQEVKEGMRFNTDNGDVVTITGVDIETVTVDGNHPLAGVELNFDVEVVEVRAATTEEVEHGHVHGANGHQH